MSKTILILVGTLCISSMAQAQEKIAEIMSIPRYVTSLPYPPKSANNKVHSLMTSGKGYHIPIELWNGELKIDLWKNFWLSKSWGNPCAFSMGPGGVLLQNTFEPLEGGYYIGLLRTYCDVHSKNILVTVDKNGGLIDQLEVGYRSFFKSETINEKVVVKEFELYDRDSISGVLSDAPHKFCVKVAHLKPDDDIYLYQPLNPDATQKDVGNIPAKLYVDYYCIDPTGHFVRWQKSD